MRAIYCVALLVISSAFFAANATAQAPVKNENTPQKVIFFGNSFTYYNNSLNYHLERMVQANTTAEAFRNYEFRAVTISGGRLAEHQELFPRILAMKPWDAVILQGHSLETINNEMWPSFLKAIQQMTTTTQEQNSTPFLFMTWAYQHKPEMILPISTTYTALGHELNASVVPVGLAFQKALEQYPELELHTEDRVHPSTAGTYLAACTFYAALYGKSPVGNTYHMGLESGVAAQLQKVAIDTVKQYQQSFIRQQGAGTDTGETANNSSSQPSTEATPALARHK